jgi:hypothetical protein
MNKFPCFNQRKKQLNCQRRKRNEKMEKSNCNGILFPPSLWWSFFSTLTMYNTLILFSHSPPSLMLSYPTPHVYINVESALCTSARYKNDIHQEKRIKTEKNHHEIFWSLFFFGFLFCCSWNDKWWKDIDMKKGFLRCKPRSRTVEWLRNEQKWENHLRARYFF